MVRFYGYADKEEGGNVMSNPEAPRRKVLEKFTGCSYNDEPDMKPDMIMCYPRHREAAEKIAGWHNKEVPKLSKEYWSGGYEPTNPRYDSTHASELSSLRIEVDVLKTQLKHSKRTEEAWKELAKAYQATARDYVGDYVTKDYAVDWDADVNAGLREFFNVGLREFFRKGEE